MAKDKEKPESSEFIPPEPVYLAVQVIEHRGPSILVEYQKEGRPYRTIVPLKELVDGKVDEYTLAALGITYGLPWEQLIQLSATPERLAAELRRNGIWTLEDLAKHQSAARGAIQAVYGTELATLIRAAHAHKEAKHDGK